MNYIFLGMPGSGKGTQVELLVKKLNIPMISTGNLFRKNIKNETKLGLKVKDILEKGDLVPDKVTFEMMSAEIKNMDISQGLILDGYPRSLRQAELLKDILNIDIILNIELSEDQVLLRIGGRRTCKCGETYHLKFNPPQKEGVCDKCGQELYIRDDAQEETIKNRIKVYKEQTEPLIKYYGDKVINIDGNPSIPEVTEEIFRKLGISD
ncbi:adenylate kinase [bacterium]|nr:adenylate kinase [bacterium]